MNGRSEGTAVGTCRSRAGKAWPGREVLSFGAFLPGGMTPDHLTQPPDATAEVAAVGCRRQAPL